MYRYRYNYNTWHISRVVTNKSTTLQNKLNNGSYYCSELNYTIQNKQPQKKFEYAKNFGVLYNCNPAHRDLFQRKWIEHMKSTHACLGTYKRNEVYHYY